MNLKFVVNDYVLIWNLLFQASISEKIHKLKQKLWINYKKEYNNTYRDKELMLKDPKNFIPNDDSIYNIVLETKEYEKIKKNTEKYRNQILKVWDNHKKETLKIIKSVTRMNIKPYQVLVVTDELDMIDTTTVKDAKVNTIVLGKKVTSDTSIKLIVELVFQIIKKELRSYKKEYKDIVEAVIELAILNEFPTRLTGRSHYLTGDPTLNYLKRQMYPYWLMYLGADKDDMLSFMMRDKIAFDVDKYPYEKELKKKNLLEFIDFCIRNQKYIVKINELEII
ncbi:MAG TPA: hypothetical protein IAB35_03830 [Candidatus Faecimonas gallistercoris]|mgnify:CR=1 FL=1|nr:hypothetical protein [Candidatus Faecimonas gallistercoris]